MFTRVTITWYLAAILAILTTILGVYQRAESERSELQRLEKERTEEIRKAQTQPGKGIVFSSEARKNFRLP